MNWESRGSSATSTTVDLSATRLEELVLHYRGFAFGQPQLPKRSICSLKVEPRPDAGRPDYTYWAGSWAEAKEQWEKGETEGYILSPLFIPRALTADEVAQLSADPWRIFEDR